MTIRTAVSRRRATCRAHGVVPPWSRARTASSEGGEEGDGEGR